MEIRKLNKNEIPDFRNLIEIFNDVFEKDTYTPDTTYLSRLLSNADFMVFVVKENDEVVGGLTIYVLHSYYVEKPIAYIYDVGIAPSSQGQGFGRALISEVCNFCKLNGFEDAHLEAESDDIDAIGFYRKTNFCNELNAKHFTYTFDNKK
jgi:aminoglycoside 3-N-acetyltransferase I